MIRLLLQPPPPIATTTLTSSYWPRLEVLTLRGCGAIDDNLWIRFIQTHPRLQHINLTFTFKLTERHPHHLTAKWTDASLDAMATWLPQLHYLNVSYARHITPQGIRRLVLRGPPSLIIITCNRCDLITKTSFPECRTSSSNNNNKWAGSLYYSQ